MRGRDTTATQYSTRSGAEGIISTIWSIILALASCLLNFAKTSVLRGYAIFGNETKREDLVVRLAREAVGDAVLVDRHVVETSDGYSLVLHRLRRNSGFQHDSDDNEVVFLQHALLESSASWVAGGADALAFRFLKRYREVWLGNNRGNLFAKRIQPQSISACSCIACDQLGVDSRLRQMFGSSCNRDNDIGEASWSFEHMAKYDFPSSIDHVRRITGASGIVCGGFSQGALQLLLYVSLFNRGEIPARRTRKGEHGIRRMFLIAPPVVLRSVSSSSVYWKGLDLLARTCLSGVSRTLSCVQASLPDFILGPVCRFVVQGRLQFILGSLDARSATLMYRVTPNGSTSRRNMSHLLRLMTSGNALHRDEADGEEPYDLRAVDCPVDVWVSVDDVIVDAKRSAAILRESLGDSVRVYEHRGFGHLDLVWTAEGRAALWDQLPTVGN